MSKFHQTSCPVSAARQISIYRKPQNFFKNFGTCERLAVRSVALTRGSIDPREWFAIPGGRKASFFLSPHCISYVVSSIWFRVLIGNMVKKPVRLGNIYIISPVIGCTIKVKNNGYKEKSSQEEGSEEEIVEEEMNGASRHF